MKKIILLLSIALILTACGKKRTSESNTAAQATIPKNLAIAPPTLIPAPTQTYTPEPTATTTPTSTSTPTSFPVWVNKRTTTWHYGTSDECASLKESRREIERGTELHITGRTKRCPDAGLLAEIFPPRGLQPNQETIWVSADLLVEPDQLPTLAPTSTYTPRPTPTPRPTKTPAPTQPTSTLSPTQPPAAPTQPPAAPTQPPAAPTEPPPPTEPPAPTQPPPPTEPPAPAPANVIISYIFYDGVVARVESDEYAQIINNGSSAVNLAGWHLNAGTPGQDFWFPSFDLQPGQSCRVYTNESHPDTCGFSFGSGQALWANDGDCGYLFNAQSEIVSQYCY